MGAAELTASLLSPAPESSLNGPVTTMRRYSAARVRLADLQEVSQAFGVTLNDVALAAITDSYRRILLDRGEQPGHNSLRTLVPVSVRSVNHFNMTDNQVSAMLPLLPVDEADPVRAAAAGAQPAHPGQSQRSTGRGQRGDFGGQKRPVRVLGVDDSLDVAVAPTGGGRLGDQRSRSTRSADD